MKKIVVISLLTAVCVMCCFVFTGCQRESYNINDYDRLIIINKGNGNVAADICCVRWQSSYRIVCVDCYSYLEECIVFDAVLNVYDSKLELIFTTQYYEKFTITYDTNGYCYQVVEQDN